jgi:hypothetical protein
MNIPAKLKRLRTMLTHFILYSLFSGHYTYVNYVIIVMFIFGNNSSANIHRSVLVYLQPNLKFYSSSATDVSHSGFQMAGENENEICGPTYWWDRHTSIG